MRHLRLDLGSTVLLNLTEGDAVHGTIAYVNAGAVFLKSASLIHGNGARVALDGEIRVPAVSIRWVQVL